MEKTEYFFKNLLKLLTMSEVSADKYKDEKWKCIKGYKNKYKISSKGRVYSIGRDIIMKLQKNGDGYSCVTFSSPHKTKLVHRLVAKHFIPNPDKKPTVNHEDGVKTNDEDINLTWATYTEQNEHVYKLGLRIPNYKPVNEIDDKGNTIKEFISMKEAAEYHDTTRQNISRAISSNGTAAGSIFKYAKKETIIISKELVQIPGFPDYQISPDGVIYSILSKKNISHTTKEGERSYVSINNEKGERVHMYVYRLIALTYIPNDDITKNEVNHINGICSTDHKNNLEWASSCSHFSNISLF
jgi:hypothetical protein